MSFDCFPQIAKFEAENAVKSKQKHLLLTRPLIRKMLEVISQCLHPLNKIFYGFFLSLLINEVNHVMFCFVF
jgi:hypothetical protein